MASRKRVSGISTTEALMMAAGAGLLIYLMKPKPAMPPIVTLPASATPAGASAATTASEVNAAASVANNIINQIWG